MIICHETKEFFLKKQDNVISDCVIKSIGISYHKTDPRIELSNNTTAMELEAKKRKEHKANWEAVLSNT